MRCALFVVLHRACGVVSYPRVSALFRLANRLAVLGVLACYLLTYLHRSEKRNGIEAVMFLRVLFIGKHCTHWVGK